MKAIGSGSRAAGRHRMRRSFAAADSVFIADASIPRFYRESAGLRRRPFHGTLTFLKQIVLSLPKERILSMCRLLGMIRTGDANLPAWKQMVGAPNALRLQAETGCVPPGSEPGHTDSWGVGWFDEGGDVSLIRNTGSAADSAYFVFAGESAGRGNRTVLAHLRKASVGALSSANAHPIRVDYSGRGNRSGRPYETLLVAHNGTIRTPLQSTLRDAAGEGDREEARADSDTVLLAGYLAARLEAAESGEGTFDTLTGALRDLFRKARQVGADSYTAVNLLLAHPSGLYALRQFTKNADYYSLSVRPLTPGADEGASGYVIASEPTDAAGEWAMLEPGLLMHYGADGAVRSAAVV